MRRYISIWAVLLIMVLVHVDWHFGRAHHHHLSLSWPYHWVTGLVAFFLLGWFCARKWPDNPLGAALVNGSLGLFAGQVVEPLLEVVGYPRAPMASVFSAERWHVFAQFAAAAAVGLLTGLGMVWARRREAISK
jgi:hypothetical protein